MTNHFATPPAPVAPCDDDCDPAGFGGLDDGACSGCSEPTCDGDCAATRLRVLGLCGGVGALGGCSGCLECTCACPVVGDRVLSGECLACRLDFERARDLDACDPCCHFRW